MSEIWLCPICYRDRGSKEARREMGKLIRLVGGASEMVGPGGRTFRFKFGTCRVPNECYWCDLDKLQACLAEHLALMDREPLYEEGDDGG